MSLAMQVIILAHICRIVHSMWLLKVWQGERNRDEKESEKEWLGLFHFLHSIHFHTQTQTRTQNDVLLKLCVLPN